MTRARVGFYGDDFTGSVDALLQFARQGWSGRLFVNVPDASRLRDAAAECDVVGIAGIARSLPTASLDAELTPALSALAALKLQIVQYKACSTADSSPEIGNLGRVIELGRALVSEHPVPALFAQPDFGRFTVFGQHFAAEDGIVYRLDRQPTMSSHPSTPMDESDLVRHLSRQTTISIASISFLSYTSSSALAAQLSKTDAAAIVLDAIDDVQLTLIGAALLSLPGPLFAIGSGGLSRAIAAAEPHTARAIAQTTSEGGPILAVSGSRSAQTRRQIDSARAAGWMSLPLPLVGASKETTTEETNAEVLSALRAGRSVVLSSGDTDAPTQTAEELLDLIAHRSADIITAAIAEGLTRRIVICGGDTSSRVTRLLGIDSLSISANPWENVVLLRAHTQGRELNGMELLLKGGQVGDDNLFERIRRLGA